MIYNLFISHSWTYLDEYERLVRLLNSKSKFYYKNYSVPKDDPIHNANNQSKLKAAIKNQMLPTSCVLILAGVYSTYSKWINIEIDLAKSMDKKIIAVTPLGAEKCSTIVKNSSDVIVNWNTDSIVNAIKTLVSN